MTVKVTITDCRAGGEPKVFTGEKNSKVARFSVAHNERGADDAGNDKAETRWFNVVGFGPAAKFIEEHVHKGTRLSITDAEMHQGRPYEGRDGQTHTPDELHVVNGRGAVIALKEAAGARPADGDEAQPAA